MPKISIIVGYRNREPQRVSRFLNSLSLQSYRDFECIFVDYGSKEAYADQVAGICNDHPFCRYIYTNTRGMYWNRSHALNTGIRAAESEFVLSTDIDMIFSRDVLSGLLESAGTNIQVVSRIFLIPENLNPDNVLTSGEYDFELTSTKAVGGAHFVARSELEKINGFDEYYCIWGREDRDCVDRLKARGLDLVWLDHQSHPIYHQWHPQANAKQHWFPSWWWDQITLHYNLERHKVVRNDDQWGRVVAETERPSLNGEPELIISFDALADNFERSNLISRIIRTVESEKGKMIEIRVSTREVRNPLSSRITGILNKPLKSLGIPIHLEASHRLTRSSTTEAVHIALLSLIKNPGYNIDYCISYSADFDAFRIINR